MFAYFVMRPAPLSGKSSSPIALRTVPVMHHSWGSLKRPSVCFSTCWGSLHRRPRSTITLLARHMLGQGPTPAGPRARIASVTSATYPTIRSSIGAWAWISHGLP